jgi:hypothetical protein
MRRRIEHGVAVGVGVIAAALAIAGQALFSQKLISAVMRPDRSSCSDPPASSSLEIRLPAPR